MNKWWLLGLLALCPLTLCTNPGVTGRLTQKGLEYGRQIGMAVLQKRLQSIKIPDISGKVKVKHAGKVKYSVSGMRIVNLGLPQSSLGLVPSSGLKLSIGNAFIKIKGRWRVKYLRVIKDSGSFDLSVSGLSISAGMGVSRDGTGHPAVSSASCSAIVRSAKVKFHGGASWLYNLFSRYIDKALRKSIKKQLCPLVAKSIEGLNPRLQTLNVLAKVDKYSEIQYSLVSSPSVTKNYIDLYLKGEFYAIAHHQEPPFTAPAFSLPDQAKSMLYLGLSQYTLNTAGFVYNTLGRLSIDITDDMLPKSSPFRLNTKSFQLIIPEIEKKYPNMPMKCVVKTSKQPLITFEPNNATLQAAGTVTAYAIQPNSTLAPLFIINVVTSVSAKVYITGTNIAGSVSLNGLEISLVESYVGPFQVQVLNNVVPFILKTVVLPQVNAYLKKGFPLPTLRKMSLVNPQIQIQKNYLLIATDVRFQP
ncbi:bactericidal permeability-increasing protein [Amia ocellicauda]|uniref:bactericidal permeability-increasing protein n=1 Tax=Amia ocellicauda TaxID=2972642 RepID=UPI003463A39E